ncbi:hypothetical protein PsorP6_014377 [Peronosclerospora sorghi]|uniref:Uncharacterized protein n=1 Tax=Peronosclerospora sorghi TaxID=230839 RepID=A0ACC0VG92_9STRA|nr:hypothetical protein PsorP6_014377 [Peronosclerospora sorghi]
MLLSDFVSPLEEKRRPPSIRKVMHRHFRALFAAIAANLLGTIIIHPLFGAAPQFEDTVKLVVPIYFIVEVVADGLRIPIPLLKMVVGLSVSWLKAIMIPKLVKEWQLRTNAHPLGFLAISTANLFASGVVLRYLAHYGRSRRVLDFSMGAIRFIFQIVGISAVIGIGAHVANRFMSSDERVVEARVLQFCIAWFALDKYWKNALRELLIWMFTSSAKMKTS